MRTRNIGVVSLTILLAISACYIMLKQSNEVYVNSSSVSNKKIGWGIKRNDSHEQPDVGAENKKLLEENQGICLGNKNQKNIYLTFDEGYEAGYTPKILEVLKANNVKATFFITAHYLNTQEDLVEQMLEEGHIVRKSHSKPQINARPNRRKNRNRNNGLAQSNV